MKYIIILGDGMADEPMESLNNKTAIQAANTPYMDMLARMGRNGLLDTIPEGFSPGSEIANLSVLGYDVPKVYEGRGVLEAASIGVDVLPGEIAMRCNLVSIDGEMLKNHSSGHISTAEATELIHFLQEKLGDETFSFHPGVSYRHVLKIKNGNKNLICTPPHDIPEKPFEPHLIKAGNETAKENDGMYLNDMLQSTAESIAASTARSLNELIFKSQELLKNHPVNKKRIQEGKDPANSIWPWSPGYRPKMKHLSEMFPIESGAVISAVDLIRGIGVYAGLEVIMVEGATGLYDTNYEGKAEAALNALKVNDFVYLHIEASDEAGHEGNIPLKVKTIEYLDERIVKTIYEEVKNWDEPVTIAILPDHPTPCAIRTHTRDPIPFIIWHRDIEPDSVQVYDEFAAREGGYGLLHSNQFMNSIFNKQDVVL